MSTESTYDRDAIGDDLEVWSVDPEDQLQPEDTLIDRGVDDVLDEGYSPPDRPRSSYAHGHESGHHETIDERIRQEEPDPFTAYGAPDDESGEQRARREKLGGDDPDAIYAEDDYVGQAGRRRSGRIVSSSEDDTAYENDLYAGDVGIDGGAASAEEAAMHIIDDEDDLED